MYPLIFPCLSCSYYIPIHFGTKNISKSKSFTVPLINLSSIKTIWYRTNLLEVLANSYWIFLNKGWFCGILGFYFYNFYLYWANSTKLSCNETKPMFKNSKHKKKNSVIVPKSFCNYIFYNLLSWWIASYLHAKARCLNI